MRYILAYGVYAALASILMFGLFIAVLRHKVGGLPLKIVAWIADVFYNVTVGSPLLLWSIPTSFTFSQMLTKVKKGTGRRARNAQWICKNIIDKYVPGHCK